MQQFLSKNKPQHRWKIVSPEDKFRVVKALKDWRKNNKTIKSLIMVKMMMGLWKSQKWQEWLRLNPIKPIEIWLRVITSWIILLNNSNRNSLGVILAPCLQWFTGRTNSKSNRHLKWQVRRIRAVILTSTMLLQRGRKVCSPLWVKTQVRNKWLVCWTSLTLNWQCRIFWMIKFHLSRATKDCYSNIRLTIMDSQKLRKVSHMNRLEKKLHLMKWNNLQVALLSRSASKAHFRIISSSRKLCWCQGAR